MKLILEKIFVQLKLCTVALSYYNFLDFDSSHMINMAHDNCKQGLDLFMR